MTGHDPDLRALSTDEIKMMRDALLLKADTEAERAAEDYYDRAHRGHIPGAARKAAREAAAPYDDLADRLAEVLTRRETDHG